MSIKPTELSRWGTDQSNEVVPTSGQQDTGWTASQLADSSFDNWYKRITYEWQKWLDDGDVDFKSLTISGTVDATVDGDTFTDDWDPASTGDLVGVGVVRVAVNAPYDAVHGLTGLIAGADGQILIVHNVSSSGRVLNLFYADTDSAAGNRFDFPASGFFGPISATKQVTTVRAGGAIILQYDATSAAWRVLANHRPWDYIESRSVGGTIHFATAFSTAGSIIDNAPDPGVIVNVSTDCYFPLPQLPSDCELTSVVVHMGATPVGTCAGLVIKAINNPHTNGITAGDTVGPSTNSSADSITIPITTPEFTDTSRQNWLKIITTANTTVICSVTMNYRRYG